MRLRWRQIEITLLLLASACLVGLGLAACSPAGSAAPSYTPSSSTAPALPATTIPLVTYPTIFSPSPTFFPLVSSSTTSPQPSFSPTPPPPTPNPEPACMKEGGQIVLHELDTERLPHPLEFRVYLPPCYQEEKLRRYPVLYLIHGQSSTDEQWDLLGVDEAADDLIAKNELPPFLIVMPRDRLWSQPDEDPFGQAVASDLLPWIDTRYRTLAERFFRAVGGLSRGAGWAVHLGLSYWELFGAIGAHSLPVFWYDTYYVKSWLNAIPAEDMPRIYMDIGDKDRPEIMVSAVWFENLLAERGIPHEWHLFSGYHEEAYWSKHLEQYLRWYAAGWDFEGRLQEATPTRVNP